jgi:integrase
MKYYLCLDYKMDRITTNEFMINLSNDLQKPRSKDGAEKPGITESSAVSYIKTLFILNNKVPFKSLAFLKKTGDIDSKLKEYADNTKKTILGAVVGVMTLKNQKGYSKALAHYREQLGVKAKELRELENTNTKSEKQEKNWESLEDINKKKADAWSALVTKVGNKLRLTPAVYEDLLNYLIVSLYTDTSPRRNQDYMNMVVVKKYGDSMPADKNYLDLANNRFVFNVYKTSRKYGQHKVAIPDELNTVLKKYLKYHPGKSQFAKVPQPFLVHHDDKPLTAINAITRILNKWFGKNIGSSMLRHIWLSSKYDISEMKKDALDMGHSVEQQKGYMKAE